MSGTGRETPPRTEPSEFDLSELRFESHPGGQRHLDMARGHARPDLLFLSYHLGRDPSRLQAMAKALDQPLPEGFHAPLYRQLSEAALRLRRDGARHIAIYRTWCLAVTLALPAVLAWYVIDLSIASGGALAFLIVTYAFNIFHMRHHYGGRLYSLGERGRAARVIDAVTSPFYDVVDELLMVSARPWIEQHNASHHVFTNHSEDDYDVTKPYGYLRLSPELEHRRYHRFQHLYAPLLLALNALTVAPENFFLKGGRLIYLIGHYALLVGLPAWLHGFWPALLAYLLTYTGTSLLISYCFQVSHNAETGVASAPETTPERMAERTAEPPTYEQWVASQLEETVSYGGYLTTLFVGGINLQVEHHLAPAIEPTLLHPFRREVERTCAAHGLRYRWMGGPIAAVAAYHRQLALLGRAP